MGMIREWAAKVTDSQRDKYISSLTDDLLRLIKAEAASASPDYEGCAIALTALHHQTVAAFYARVYPDLSADVQVSINGALLEYADTGLGKAAACSRIAQAIQQRLKNGEPAEGLTAELQWYVGRISTKILANNAKNIWSSCGATNLEKLFSLDVSSWSVDSGKLQEFYSTIFQLLQAADGKTISNALLVDFLEKNHLNDSADVNPPSLSQLPPPSLSAQSTDADNKGDRTSVPSGETTINVPTDIQEITVPADLEKDGVRLAELLLTWAKSQKQGSAALKEALRSSNNELKRLQDRFARLRDDLFTAKKEIEGRDAIIADLNRELIAARHQLDEAQAKLAERDATVKKLMQMDDNTADQAVSGYKTELASALKSIVEDARLPEAQSDADILSALLGDLLDTLRFKGIPLEEG